MIPSSRTWRSIAQMTVVWRKRTPGSSGRRGRRGATEKCSADATRHPAQPGEHAGRRPGDEAARMRGRQHGAALFERDRGGRDRRTRPWPTHRKHAGARRAVGASPADAVLAEPGRGDHAVVVGEPAGGQGGRSAIGPSSGRSEGGGCRCQRTVRQGCAVSPSAWCGRRRAPRTRLAHEHSTGRVRWGGGSGIRRGRRCRRGTGRSRCPRGARGPSPSRPAPAAPRTGPCSRLGSYCTAVTTKKRPEMNSTSDLAA